MAERSHWEFKDEAEMWTKLIGETAETMSKSAATLQKLIGKGDHMDAVLEIGAGCGRLLKYATCYADLAIGVDYSWGMVHASTKHLRGYPRSRVLKNDGRILPFGNSSFDAVYSFTVFQHIPELETIVSNMREARRVLKDGGLFSFQTVIGDRGQLGRYDGYVFKDPEEIKKLLLDLSYVEVAWDLDGEWVWVKARK